MSHKKSVSKKPEIQDPPTGATDDVYMLRAIQIGKNGLGQTAPNPMVGAVIVNDGRIIGEGFTSAYGGPHAEVNAIHSVKDQSVLPQSTLYVTLEPCSHYGKTPPCADLIVQTGIPKVVIGIQDPHTKVAGKGMERLKKAGIDVILGVMEAECREHHKRFLTFMEKKRPYVVLKWALTTDGFMAPDSTQRSKVPQPFWITDRHSRQLVHKWRTEEQALLVGTRTVLDDNPKLDARLWKGQSPLRVVLDPLGAVPQHYHVYDGRIPSLIFTEQDPDLFKIENATVVQLPFDKDWPQKVCDHLYKNQVLSVLVEGGAKTLQAFLDHGLWDEARVLKGPITFGAGLKAPILKTNISSEKKLDGDYLAIYTHDKEHNF